MSGSGCGMPARVPPAGGRVDSRAQATRPRLAYCAAIAVALEVLVAGGGASAQSSQGSSAGSAVGIAPDGHGRVPASDPLPPPREAAAAVTSTGGGWR